MDRTEQLLADIDYLEKIGMTVDQPRSLHHWSVRPEASKRDYFSPGQEMKANNAAFADQLRLVADLHQRGIAGLVEVAIQRHAL